MDFLGRIRKLDSSLQRGLDNGFARVFGGKVVPNELEECLKQEIEDFLMQDADGQYLAPNDFCIGLSSSDFANLSSTDPDLPEQLADRMSRYCRNNGWATSGAIVVNLHDVESLHTGQLKTASQFTENQSGTSSFEGSSLADASSPAPDHAATRSAFHANPEADAQPNDTQSHFGSSTTDTGAAGVAGASTVGANVEKPDYDQPDAEQFPTASRPVIVPEAAQQEETTTITLLLQDGSNRTFEVRPGSNIIGRGTASDFRLPDTGVSRQHAEITWDGNDAVLVDLHSTNGTIVNNEPIENWLLADGDVISMGHSVMDVRFQRHR